MRHWLSVRSQGALNFRTGDECSIYKVDLGMGKWPRLQKGGLEVVEQLQTSILAALEERPRRITIPAGTDVELSIGVAVVCRPHYPTWDALCDPIPLWGEYDWALVEKSVNGTVEIDGITEATSICTPV